MYRVLIVEDEDLYRKFISKILQKNYRCDGARNAEEAKALFLKHSYDIALYEEFAKKKGFAGHPVAGKADILVVPFIVSGNILYKSWVMTMGAEVANVVLGAKVPVILTSRSDTDMVKFLTLCAGALYSNYLEGRKA